MKSNWKSVFLTGIVCLFFLPGCVRDYLDDDGCDNNGEGGIKLTFYSKSPCEIDSLYPDQVEDLIVGVFNENDVLIYHNLHTDINLSRSYNINIDILSGLYTVMAWSGVATDSHIQTYDIIDGVSQKSDLFFSIKRNQHVAETIDERIYFGQIDVMHDELTSSRSEYTSVGINILELTNRFTILVEGLGDKTDDYEVIIEANNGTVKMDGTLADDEVIEYYPIHTIKNGVITAQITLLKLDTEHQNTLVIRNKNGTELYRENLLQMLLLKNPNLNLDCDHDFTLSFRFGDDANTIMKIWVNDWLVHSYDTEL